MKIPLTSILLIGLLVGCGKNNNDENEFLGSLTSEPLHREQWAMAYNLDFYDMYNIASDAHIHGRQSLSQYTGKGIKIAVIDSMINAEHDELAGRITSVINAHDNSSTTVCGWGDDCGHGTAVTGVIASKINNSGLRGFAPNSDIVFIHLDLNGFVRDSDYVNAFDIAENNQVDIVLCSWGTGDVSPAVKEKIQHLANTGRNGKGTVIIFATGNNAGLMDNDESMLDSVIGVGSSDEFNDRSYYSSYGIGLDLLAPGGDLFGITTLRFKDNGYLMANDYDRFIGSSASAPIVASLVALLLEADPTLTVKQIYALMTLSADKIGNTDYINGHNEFYGYGKINFDAALSQLKLLQGENNTH